MQQAAFTDSCLTRDENHLSLTCPGLLEVLLQHPKLGSSTRVRRQSLTLGSLEPRLQS